MVDEDEDGEEDIESHKSGEEEIEIQASETPTR
jgi:hypothetical protein